MRVVVHEGDETKREAGAFTVCNAEQHWLRPSAAYRGSGQAVRGAGRQGHGGTRPHGALGMCEGWGRQLGLGHRTQVCGGQALSVSHRTQVCGGQALSVSHVFSEMFKERRPFQGPGTRWSSGRYTQHAGHEEHMVTQPGGLDAQGRGGTGFRGPRRGT